MQTIIFLLGYNMIPHKVIDGTALYNEKKITDIDFGFLHQDTYQSQLFFLDTQCSSMYHYVLKGYSSYSTPPNFRDCAQRKVPAKRFKICHILYIQKPKVALSILSAQTRALIRGKNKVARNEKWKKQLWGFVCLKYGKVLSSEIGRSDTARCNYYNDT